MHSGERSDILVATLIYLFSIISLFIPFDAFASEIAFLPVILRMDSSRNARIKNVSEYSLAELSAFYADENFLIDVRKFKRDAITANPNYSKFFLSNKCNELETDYLFLSEVEIADSTVIHSRVYNCKGKFVSQKESIIRDRFFTSFEKHIQKTLRFLPEKKNSQIPDEQNNEEIIFLIDPSPSFTSERENLQSVISEIANSSNIHLGLIFPSRRNPRFIHPSHGNKEAMDALINFRKEKIFLEDVKDAILHSMEGLGKNKNRKKKMIIATGAKPNTTGFDFSEVVSSLTRLDYEVYLITGSYFDSTSFEIYKKAGRKSGKGLQYITHYQKIGTPEGLKTIFINGQKIFLGDGFEAGERDFDSTEKVQIPASQVFSKTAFPNYGNMTEIYELVYQKKILEKGKIGNNIKSVVHNILENKRANDLPGHKKILIQSGNTSMWVKISVAGEELAGKEITLKTTFVKDKNSSFGFSNLPSQTSINPGIAPSMLTYSTKEISEHFRHGDGTPLKCFLKGKVYEVK